MERMSACRLIPIAITGAALLLAGCSIDTKGNTYSGIFVHGVVSNEAGAPVAAVQIRVGYRAMAACSTAGFSASAIAPSTDSVGVFGVGLVDSGKSHAVCVKIVATPPSTQALAADSVLVSNVTLTETLSDSIRIDLVLPPKLQ
jgi:hypothetical protein